ncbi:MAG: DUF4428 domain-containing protein [Clostridiales bacterium]|nr:DUF4428 domain-containing protein [Clostridiales bacterium]
MGLFGKKELCPVCGKKVKGDLVLKIKDNVVLCQSCSAQVNMDAALIPLQTVEDIRQHLVYREQNQDMVDRFNVTWSERVGTSYLCVDATRKLWYCTRNRKDKNPPLLSYEEVVSAVYLEDGEPVAEEEKKGAFGRLFGEKTEPKTLHSMKIHVEVDNPYTKFIDVEAIPVNEEVRTGTMSYKSHRRALNRVMEMMQTMMNGSETLPEEAADIPPEVTAEETFSTDTAEESAAEEISEE